MPEKLTRETSSPFSVQRTPEQLKRIAGLRPKVKGSLSDLIRSLPPGTRSSADIQKEFDELRGRDR